MKSEEINVILTVIQKLYKLNTTLKAWAILRHKICAVLSKWYAKEMSFSKTQRLFQLRFSFFKTLMAYVPAKEQIMLIISLACSNLPF